MLEGLHSAAAGMVAQQHRIDAISNDLANVSTPGYRNVRVGFRDLLYTGQERFGGDGVQAGSGAAASVIGRGQAQGALNPTGEPLDLAIVGNGFFQVRAPDGGIALTRDGTFALDGQGRLSTQNGQLVLPPIRVPGTVAPDDIRVGADGTVTLADGRRLGQIGVVTVPSADGLQPLGNNLFAVTPQSGPTQAAAGAEIKQGAIEASNVDLASAMVDLMDAQRSYSLMSKAIQTQDQMMQTANQVLRR